mmetsp:Transcript_31026/g.27440  ORF Transcript_31026/g.27440 Transcript_31026/m.27440 type:complete len:266 (+) Transcript_31026:13-810(+)
MNFEQFFWGEDQGHQYRRFDQLRVSYNTIQTFRIIAGAFLLFICTFGIFFSGDGEWYYFFLTIWGAHFALIQMPLDYHAAQDQRYNPGKVTGIKFKIWRMGVWFTPLSICFQIVITVIYWAFLDEDPSDDIKRRLFLILIHTTPFIFVLIEFLMQKWLFRKEHFLATFIVAILYTPVNYFGSTWRGEPLYPIIIWDPVWLSLLIFAGMALVLYLLFIGLVRLTKTVNINELENNQVHLKYALPMIKFDQDTYVYVPVKETNMMMI